MNRIWNYISFLGLEGNNKTYSNRNIIITNRLNFILLCLLIFLNVFTAIIREVNHGEYTIHTKKLLLLLLVCILNGLLSFFKYHKASIYNLIFLPTLIGVLLPIFFGFVQKDDLYLAPLAIIGFSFVPQMILKPSIKNLLYSVSLVFFLLLIVFMNNILVFFSSSDITTNQIYRESYIYYKIVLISVFVFIHSTMFYLRSLNERYEAEITESNEEIKSTLEELKRAQQHLVQSEKMASIGNLTAGVAHEINNPLNFISGGLQIISGLNEEIKNSVSVETLDRFKIATSMINTGVERSSSIVRALATFSHRDSSLLVNSDVNSIIDNTLLFLKTKISDNIQVIKDFKLNIDIPVYPGQIHQVIHYIIDNAIHAVNQNKEQVKKIAISTQLADNIAIIQISNNGPKIPENLLNQIFDPFFTTKDPGVGTGLGLSLCYSLISEHQGRIYAKNNDDGVSFIIELPLSVQ